ncbi:IDUA (predicted) [Pycnogonum litorale]
MSTYISASKLFVAIIFNVICIFRVKSVGNDVGYSRVFVDADKVVSALPHFWESTGLCPPDPHQNAGDFLLSSDMLTNLALISSVPHLGIKQVRIHWLLNLVSANWSKSSIGIRYDYGRLDKFLLYMNSVRLRPGFELMGNPSSTFTDFEDPKQVREWRDFIGELARHYIDLFGVEEIRTWNFETWNEPDHHDFDNLTFTVQGFLNYYDACSEGLRLADPYLKFGGPGGSFRLGSFSKICWALLDHVSSGKNYFTGKNVRMDFISFHEKVGIYCRKYEMAGIEPATMYSIFFLNLISYLPSRLS